MPGEMVLANPDFVDPKCVAQVDFLHDGLDALRGRLILMPADDFELAELHVVLLSSLTAKSGYRRR